MCEGKEETEGAVAICEFIKRGKLRKQATFAVSESLAAGFAHSYSAKEAQKERVKSLGVQWGLQSLASQSDERDG